MDYQQKTAKRDYDRARYARLKAKREAQRPADAIATLTPEERAYIAGLVDGEGSIYVAAVGPERHRSVYPIVTIAMTHRGVIDWLTQRLQAGTVKLHNQTNLRRHPYMKPQYRFQVFGKRAKMLCEAMLPYLKVKVEQARLVTTFPVDARIAPGVKIEHSEINEVRYRLRDQINALNHESGRERINVERRKDFFRES
jgi:hypothetical protein